MSIGNDAKMDSETLVVLVHGFCRNGQNMQYWRESLSEVFSNVICADMPATHGSFQDCLHSLENTVAEAHPEKYKRLFFAGHSMGGLLAREYLAKYRPRNAAKLVCVGTPHYGSKLADLALVLGFPWSGIVFPPLWALRGRARRKLTTPEIPGLKIGVIASKNNAHWPGKLFLSKDADGLVESFSALAPDACAQVLVNAPHDPMQYDAEVAALIKRFFVNGKFDIAEE